MQCTDIRKGKIYDTCENVGIKEIKKIKILTLKRVFKLIQDDEIILKLLILILISYLSIIYNDIQRPSINDVTLGGERRFMKL